MDVAINVFVFDRNDQPVPGAEVCWTVIHGGKSKELGPVTTEGLLDKPAKLQVSNNLDEPFVAITVSYDGVEPQTQRVKAEPNDVTFKLDMALPPINPGGRTMWGALEDTRRNADADYKNYDVATRNEFGRHRKFGIWVVILSTIVSTSVFGALTQTQPDVRIQVATGGLAILAAVLSAVQTFYGFEERSQKMRSAAMDFYVVKREIDMFFDRYPAKPTDPKLEAEARTQEKQIHDSYANAKKQAPII